MLITLVLSLNGTKNIATEIAVFDTAICCLMLSVRVKTRANIRINRVLLDTSQQVCSMLIL